MSRFSFSSSDSEAEQVQVTNPSGRAIILLDLDSYEAQVWMNRLRPELANIDVPVVVKNRDDIVIAYNYTAKASGVTRGNGRESLREARRLCPDLEEIQVPERYGRIDAFYPLTESYRILHTIQALLRKRGLDRSVKMQRASNDEFYLDVTEYAAHMANFTGCGSRRIPSDIATLIYSTKQNPCLNYHGEPRLVMEGRRRKITLDNLYYRIQQVYTNPSYHDIYQHHENELLLVHGALLADQIISYIQRKTGYHCSAGVASNKLLAKLACSENKPEGICIITDISLPRIFNNRDFRDIPGFHSKQGYDLTIELMKPKYGFYHEATPHPSFTFNDIQELDEETLFDALRAIRAGQESDKAETLYKACRGRDDSVVNGELYRKSMKISMSFKGSRRCRNSVDLYHRIDDLALDMSECLDYSTHQLGRQMQTMSVKVSMRDGGRYDGPSGLDIRYDRNNNVYVRTLRNFANDVASGSRWDYHLLEEFSFQAKDVKLLY